MINKIAQVVMLFLIDHMLDCSSSGQEMFHLHKRKCCTIASSLLLLACSVSVKS